MSDEVAVVVVKDGMTSEAVWGMHIMPGRSFWKALNKRLEKVGKRVNSVVFVKEWK